MRLTPKLWIVSPRSGAPHFPRPFKRDLVLVYFFAKKSRKTKKAQKTAEAVGKGGGYSIYMY
ncbi:MAG: hypothetical protein EWV75_15800 [Microcystis wesenbergii Mw_QC_S_20081001_S30D]|uniref:Uncharacterized protein n=1 Tax=Microcystis wesenbergii Mw_QC_S_20081001_S30D TaxID=2486245 RepID=A0A552JFA9_9CHRO|nr:MAG: hypothetical protein EWV73_22425 [Microcystis wesenbergii Mw_QC_B_20070930_S4D]TRU94419.1 MAG: hypothetical protein EWV75_15800 [Microcystis wesenbergii Mw_QC_S_20081001_S30D]